jgi:hypothetical protein
MIWLKRREEKGGIADQSQKYDHPTQPSSPSITCEMKRRRKVQ